MESGLFSQETIDDLVIKRRIEDRKNYAIDIVTWGTKYIQSLLLDYNISIRRDFKGAKVRVILEIDCVPEDLEKEVSGIEKKPTIVSSVAQETKEAGSEGKGLSSP